MRTRKALAIGFFAGAVIGGGITFLEVAPATVAVLMKPLEWLPATADGNTFDYYAHYWQSNSPPYFDASQGADHCINFFNPDDYALSKWQLNQDLKPDDTLNYAFWQYPGTNYFTRGLLQFTYLNFPADTYEIYSFCDEARCYALGAQPNVNGSFSSSEQVALSDPPFVFGSAHKGHSAQFRSTSAKRSSFWNKLLIKAGLMEE